MSPALFCAVLNVIFVQLFSFVLFSSFQLCVVSNAPTASITPAVFPLGTASSTRGVKISSLFSIFQATPPSVPLVASCDCDVDAVSGSAQAAVGGGTSAVSYTHLTLPTN